MVSAPAISLRAPTGRDPIGNGRNITPIANDCLVFNGRNITPIAHDCLVFAYQSGNCAPM